jgi:cobalt/nickel transport system permease protein
VHVPDGFLATQVWATLDLAAATSVGLVVRRAQRSFDEARIPLLGVMGAFVFAAQMINFPVAAGTTSHVVGGALLAFTLGPAAACVVMTAILAIQRSSSRTAACWPGRERGEYGAARSARGLSAVLSLG